MKHSVKFDSKQLRNLINAEVNSLVKEQRLYEYVDVDNADDDKFYFTEIQQQVQDVQVALEAFVEVLTMLEDMTKAYGDPEFKFDGSEAHHFAKSFAEDLDEYSLGVDATAEQEVDSNARNWRE